MPLSGVFVKIPKENVAGVKAGPLRMKFIQKGDDLRNWQKPLDAWNMSSVGQTIKQR